MKTLFLSLVIGFIPLFLFSQADLTITPDSLFCDVLGNKTITLSNNTTQPINLLSVQQHCTGCHGWYWYVLSMSVTTPHFIYPGQSETVLIEVVAGISMIPSADYIHSTMLITSSVGSQYCHIMFNSSIPMALEEKSKSQLNVYPNPAQSILSIELNDPTDFVKTVEIYNVMGKLLESKAVNNNTFTMNIDTYECGMYVTRILTSKMSFIKMFIKE